MDTLLALDAATLRFVVSKVLGYGIVAGSAFVKLPQVLNILRAQSIDGLSAASILMEMTATACSFAYYLTLWKGGDDYPFSTWGETFFLFVGQACITLLYCHYKYGLFSSRSTMTIAPIAALGIVMYARAVPDIVLPTVLCVLLGRPAGQVLTCGELAGGLPIALMLVGRLPQILRNQQQGHTGQLSLIMYALNVIGSAARAFTVIQELNDSLALTSAVSGVIQNAVLVAQILALGGPPKSTGVATEARRAKKPTKVD
jgi:mannose-P-dolichol utilization defect protein 1